MGIKQPNSKNQKLPKYQLMLKKGSQNQIYCVKPLSATDSDLLYVFDPTRELPI